MTRIEVPNSSQRRRSSGRGARLLFIFLSLVIVGLGLWTWLTLAWSYADGDRAGLLQKFTNRGWLCKTYEGDLAQYNIAAGGAVISAVAPQIWAFSVRDKSVAEQISKAVGHRVQLHYTEHPGVPTSCFADTRYYVDRVTVVDNGPATPDNAPMPAPAPIPAPGAAR
jgi:hypothetical protein